MPLMLRQAASHRDMAAWGWFGLAIGLGVVLSIIMFSLGGHYNHLDRRDSPDERARRGRFATFDDPCASLAPSESFDVRFARGWGRNVARTSTYPASVPENDIANLHQQMHRSSSRGSEGPG